MYTAHTSVLPFKDNRFRSQIPNWVCTSEQFRSSWSQGPNDTPRMQMIPSLQQKGLRRVTPPLQPLSRKPSLFSKLILAPAIFSYLATNFFTASMFKRLGSKIEILSVYADTFAKRGPAKGMPCRAVRP